MGIEYTTLGLAKVFREIGATYTKPKVAPFSWNTIEPKPPVLTLTLHTGALEKRARVRQMWAHVDFSRRTCSSLYMEFRKTEYGRRWCAIVRAIAVLACGGMQC